MRSHGPLCRRLFAWYFAVSFAGIVALALFSGNRLHAIRYEAQLRTLHEESRLAFALIEEDLQQNRREIIQQRLQSLGHAIGCRFTVIAEDGRVLADTEANPGEMENHRLRPEIVAAAARGEGYSIRFSYTIKQQLMYLANRVDGAAGSIYFMRLAVPVSMLEKGLQIFDVDLAIATAAALVLAAACCLYLARRYSAPIVALNGFAQALAGGEFRRRIAPSGSGETAALGGALNTVAGRLSALQADASTGRDELLPVLEGMSVGVIAVDAQQRIFLCNAAAAGLFDFPADGAEGRALWETIREESVLKAATRIQKDDKPASLRYGPVRGRHVEVFLSPLLYGGLRGLLIVAQDATQSVQYQELRKEFVANVSHELRTPLTFIMGFVETLRDGALRDPNKAVEYLAIIDQHVRQLKNLVDDLLEISRLESRSSLPRVASVDLRETIRKVVDLLAPAAAKKNQALAVQLPPSLPAAKGDPDYLERAISNLIENAIKYTPEKGAIRVSAAFKVSGFEIQVSDNGIGIPPDDLPRIFERFYRVDKSRSREMGGTGLGLSIVKHIAQAHGGAIEVSSEPGKGSVFSILLPLQAPVE